MLRQIRNFWVDDSGATAIEYGLIGTFMGVILIVAFHNVGGKLKSTFNDIASNLSS
jgi:pilus assembly protein Flp/PilA